MEEAHARATLRATADLLDGVDPDGWDEVVIGAARHLWHASAHASACAALGLASWEGLWATFEGAHRRLDGLAAWVPEFRRQAWRAALASAGVDGPDADGRADVLAARYIAGQRHGHPLLPGALRLVERLAAVVPVAVVTNGPPDIQRLKIEQSGIGQHLSTVVISGELGVGKPDPAIFSHALGQLGVTPERAVMVGDSWERDVRGALSAGMRAVWISHGRSAPTADERVRVVAGPGDL